MGTIGWVIFAGLTHFNAARAFDFPPGAFRLSHEFFTGLGGALLVATYDYWGYYNVCYLGDEIKRSNPEHSTRLAAFHSAGGLSISTDELVHPRRDSVAGDAAGWPQQQRVVRGVVVHAADLRDVGGAGGNGVGNRYRVRFGVTLTLGYSRVPYAAALDGNYFRAFAEVPSGSSLSTRFAGGTGFGGGGLLFLAVETRSPPWLSFASFCSFWCRRLD